MWIVRLALRRPYSFVVLAVGIVLIGVLTIGRMATDIYPKIDIPVVAAIWTYTGLPPQEMEGRITSMFERAVTTTVSGIEHIESQSLSGTAVVKDRKSTRLNSSHGYISYAVFCLKKKKDDSPHIQSQEYT